MDDVYQRQLGGQRNHGRQRSWADHAAQPASVPGRHSSLEESGITHSGPYTAPSVFRAFNGDTGALASSIAESSVEAFAPTPLRESPTDVAESGFRGTPSPLPHRAELEASFGLSLDEIEAYTDEGAQAATAALGAHAFASGNRVAFATSNPDAALVAHELTHVLQHAGHDDAASDGGIDVSGEAEAEAVQASVAAGKPATAALARGRAPGRRGRASARRKPALSSPFCSRMSFSPTGLEQSGVYRLWSGAKISAPIPMVPGLSFEVSPSVSVAVGGGVDWSQPAVRAELGIDGTVALGLAYGAAALAKISASARATATGAGTYERTRSSPPAAAGAASHEAATQATSQWSLAAGINLGASLVVGVALGGGILEKRFTLGELEVGNLEGIRFENGRMNRDLTWTWGAPMQTMFAELQDAIDQAQRIMAMPAEAAAEAWERLGRAGGWAYNGLETMGRGIRDATYATGRVIADTYGGGHGTPGADSTPNPLQDPFVWGY